MRDDGYHVTGNNICFLAGAPIRDSYITVTVLQIAGVEDLSYGITLRRASARKLLQLRDRWLWPLVLL